MIIRALAESQVFNNPMLTPMVSAFNAELYEASTYLSVKADEIEEENQRIEERNRKSKLKR